MIELNLLPPQEKELLNLEQIRRWELLYVGNILLIVIGFTIVLSLIWFSILIQLKSYSQSLQDIAISFQGQNVDRQKQLSSDLNQYLAKLNNIQKDHKYYSAAIIELVNAVPPGVRIESLLIDEKNQVGISGFAPQRTLVLMLQDALTKSQFFTKIENPMANLTKPIDINFKFKFNIKPEKLIK